MDIHPKEYYYSAHQILKTIDLNTENYLDKLSLKSACTGVPILVLIYYFEKKYGGNADTQRVKEINEKGYGDRVVERY